MYMASLGATQPPVSRGAVYGSAGAAGAVAGAAVAIQTGSPLRGAVAGAGAAIVALAPLAGPAAPFVAAAGAVVQMVSTMFRGCGDTCIIASQVADQAQTALLDLKAQYFALPQRTRAAQTAMLAAIDNVLAQLQAACSNPQLGPAGQRCISERLVRGGTAPWCPEPGHTGCDWITTLRDPVANDPGVIDDNSGFSAALEQTLTGSLGSSGSLLLVAAALIAAGVFL